MIFSRRDIDLMRLLRWGRCISNSDGEKLFTGVVISNLQTLNLIKLHQREQLLTLTVKGNELLESIFQDLPDSKPLAYKPADTQRRLRVSKLIMTAYRAGIDPFTLDIRDLSAGPGFFLPTLDRSGGTNPWGSSRIAGIIRLGDLLGAAHYVCPGIGKVQLADELHTFANNTAQVKDVRRVILYCGESYEEILLELRQPRSMDAGKFVSYGEAFRLLHLPVFLIPCSDTGARQMQVMAVPDYRKRLTQAALKSWYTPSPDTVPAWDAIYDGTPFVMAADMDVRRIDAAIEAAHAHGQQQIALAVLEEQAEQIPITKYQRDANARVFALTGDALAEAGVPGSLITPGRGAFQTQEGDVVDAPLIQTHRKTGR